MQWCSEQSNTEWVDEMTGLVQRSMDGRQTRRQTRCFIMSGEIHQCSLRLRDCFSNMRTFWETLRNKLAMKYKLILVRSCRGLYATSEREIGLAIKVNLLHFLTAATWSLQIWPTASNTAQIPWNDATSNNCSSCAPRLFEWQLCCEACRGSHNAISTDML